MKMPRTPRPHVHSFRATDDEAYEIAAALARSGRNRADFLLAAALEKARRDRQQAFTEALRRELR
ncbi:hypothetical protein [Geobacter sp.]|uniref:hypothetical protein n=1 Tax=Geobacter sp. TaxID=46610 RepID=UPI00263972D7|nr:hypothetical protein [Geobacter sp.]